MDDAQYLAIGAGVTALVVILNLFGFIALPLIVRECIKRKSSEPKISA